MKGGGGGTRLRMPLSQNKNNTNSTGLALAGGAALGSTAGGGVSAPVLTTCPPEDKTFMCKLTRFYNSFKMILSIILTILLIVGMIWLAVWWYRSKR